MARAKKVSYLPGIVIGAAAIGGGYLIYKLYKKYKMAQDALKWKSSSAAPTGQLTLIPYSTFGKPTGYPYTPVTGEVAPTYNVLTAPQYVQKQLQRAYELEKKLGAK